MKERNLFGTLALIGAMVLITIALTGCMSTSTFQKRVETMQPLIQSCQDSVITLAAQRDVAAPAGMDTRDQIIWQLIKSHQPEPTLQECHTLAIKTLEVDARARQMLISGGTTLLGYGIGAWAISDIFNSVSELGMAKGNSSITNSRVLDASEGGGISHSSASGDNLFLGNSTAVDNSLAQGGIQPRQAIVNDATEVTSPSQSGTNEPSNPDIGDEDAVIQPIE